MKNRKQMIWFDHPANSFFERLPIGNGRLGAMPSGGVLRESVILNENSVWSGSREDSDREDAWRYLPEIRTLLHEGRHYEAEKRYLAHFTCKGPGSNYAHGSTVPFGCYQTLGRLNLSFFQAVSAGMLGGIGAEDYRRELDLSTGIQTESFSCGRIRMRREWFACRKPDVIALRLGASEPGCVSFSLGLDRDECGHIRASSDTLYLSGQLSDGKRDLPVFGDQPDGPAVRGGTGALHDTGTGVRFVCGVRVISEGGCVYPDGNRLMVSDADSVLVLIAARTDLKGFMGRSGEDPDAALEADLREAAQADLEAESVSRYQKEFCNMSLTIGDETEDGTATDDRLRAIRAGKEDPSFAALYFTFARYLLYASSRPDDLPANLQGIWAEEIQTPWNGDWHLNAQQQIYWLAEAGNLSAAHLPYLRLAEELMEPGRQTAWKYYRAKGWVVHTMTNPWGFTSPLENAAWGSTLTSGAWLCHHLFDHYLYTLDREYLAWAYPVIKESALFYRDLLVEKGDRLVLSPSSSPENCFLDAEGRRCSLCEGSAYDRELLTAVFSYCVQAQYVLDSDAEFAVEAERILEKLAPVETAPDGRIREWDGDYPEAFPFHRHLSHLWGVYPGFQISREETPELANAAYRSLLGRKSTTAGWAQAYRLCVAARLREGETASCLLQGLFRNSTANNLLNIAYHCDETVEDVTPPDPEKVRHPFQLDGNEAGAAGILLMLLDDRMEILPDGEYRLTVSFLHALPQAWKSGSITGARVRGGITVSFSWEERAVTAMSLEGPEGTKLTLRFGGAEWKVTLSNGRFVYGSSEKHVERLCERGDSRVK